MWTNFPESLARAQGAKRYVILFEYTIATTSMNDQENLALRACSLRAIPPPSPEVEPLEGLSGTDLHEANLTEWASYIQDVASGMRKPPQAVMNCPV